VLGFFILTIYHFFDVRVKSALKLFTDEATLFCITIFVLNWSFLLKTNLG